LESFADGREELELHGGLEAGGALVCVDGLEKEGRGRLGVCVVLHVAVSCECHDLVRRLTNVYRGKRAMVSPKEAPGEESGGKSSMESPLRPATAPLPPALVPG